MLWWIFGKLPFCDIGRICYWLRDVIHSKLRLQTLWKETLHMERQKFAFQKWNGFKRQMSSYDWLNVALYRLTSLGFICDIEICILTGISTERQPHPSAYFCQFSLLLLRLFFSWCGMFYVQYSMSIVWYEILVWLSRNFFNEFSRINTYCCFFEWMFAAVSKYCWSKNMAAKRGFRSVHFQW